MSKTFPYTAEAIEYRLDLIDPNKNFLQYPYSATLLEDMEDAGDGSFLITGTRCAGKSIEFGTAALPKGTYTVSIVIVQALTEKVIDNPGFSVKLLGTNVNASTQSSEKFTCTSAIDTTVKATLEIPSTFDTDILVRIQIESGEKQTTWAPYMDKIGNYVDERFNSTAAKLKVLTKRLETLEALLSEGVVLLAKNDE